MKFLNIIRTLSLFKNPTQDSDEFRFEIHVKPSRLLMERVKMTTFITDCLRVDK